MLPFVFPLLVLFPCFFCSVIPFSPIQFWGGDKRTRYTHTVMVNEILICPVSAEAQSDLGAAFLWPLEPSVALWSLLTLLTLIIVLRCIEFRSTLLFPISLFYFLALCSIFPILYLLWDKNEWICCWRGCRALRISSSCTCFPLALSGRVVRNSYTSSRFSAPDFAFLF